MPNIGLLQKQADADFQLVHGVADKLTPKLRNLWLAALEDTQEQLPIGEIAEALRQQNFGKVGELIGQLTTDPAELVAALETTVAGTGVPTAAEFGLNFTAVNQSAVRWAEREAGQLISGVTEETRRGFRAAIRQITSLGISEGIPPRAQARLLRETVGTTKQQAAILGRFFDSIVDETSDVDFAIRQTRRMRQRMITQRAETIARTETIRAANRGQHIAWNQAADVGLIDRTQARRVWIATADSRTCPICNDLDGQTIGWDDAFRSEVPKETFTDQTPPAHPRCRCAVGLAF